MYNYFGTVDIDNLNIASIGLLRGFVVLDVNLEVQILDEFGRLFHILITWLSGKIHFRSISLCYNLFIFDVA